jgi:hypothetical protein
MHNIQLTVKDREMLDKVLLTYTIRTDKYKGALTAAYIVKNTLSCSQIGELLNVTEKYVLNIAEKIVRFGLFTAIERLSDRPNKKYISPERHRRLFAYLEEQIKNPKNPGHYTARGLWKKFHASQDKLMSLATFSKYLKIFLNSK